MTQIQSISLFGVAAAPAAVRRAAPNERILVAAETATLDSGIRRRLTLAQRQTLTEIV